MVQCLTPALGGSDGYAQVLFDALLSDEITQRLWPETLFQRQVISSWFAGYYALYQLSPACFLAIIPYIID